MNELRTATDLHRDVQFIKDTYPKLFDRLCESWYAETSTGVSGGFIWSLEDEGHSFWLAVDDGEWNKAKLLQPQYFVSEEEE